MPIAWKKLIDDLTTAGLLAADEVAELVQSLPEDKRTDAQELTKALVRRKKLTRFQATSVYEGKANSLVFGEYVLLDKIGAGGMGLVFRARHRRMKREVAIKVLPGGSLDDEDAVHRFYQEVEAAARLLHPNIVTAFDAGQHGKTHYLVMEYVEGQDLSEVIKASGPFPVAAAVKLILQAARGLQYAHGEGLVHRDIKPANLLLDQQGNVKILDMGLARVANAGMTDSGLTRTGQIMGTVDYMAPEQAADTRKADARADIYSLGCTLYRLLTGNSVFEGETIMNKMMAHANQRPPDLRTLGSETPDGLNAAFQKMVAKRPGDRQQSMTEVISDLQPFALVSAESVVANSRPAASADAGDLKSDSQRTDFFGGITPATQANYSNRTTAFDETIDVQDPVTELTAELPANAGTASAGNISRHRVLIGLCIAGMLALLGVMTIFLQSPHGTVRIEVLDTSLEVVVDSTGAVIKGDKEFEEIALVPGKDKLKIKRGEFEFFTDDFELKKGEHVLIRIDYLDGDVQVLKDGKPVSVIPATAGVSTAGQVGDTQADAPRVDLLKLVDGARDGQTGIWSKPNELVGRVEDGSDLMLLQIPYIPPQEYDLNLVVDPNPRGALIVVLQTEHCRFRVAVDRFANGLGSERHTTIGDLNNPAAEWHGRLLKPGEANDVRFELRNNGLRIVCNGQQIADWKGDWSAPEFHDFKGYPTSNPKCLAIGSVFDPLHVHSIELVAVTGEGTLAIPARQPPNASQ